MNIPKCNVCGLLYREHTDVADCMMDLMSYILPEVRETPEFQRAVYAGYRAIRVSLANPEHEIVMTIREGT